MGECLGILLYPSRRNTEINHLAISFTIAFEYIYEKAYVINSEGEHIIPNPIFLTGSI